MILLQRFVRAPRSAAFLALAAVAFATPARGAFIGSFSGNTQPNHTSPGQGVGGTINFAVYDRTTGGSAGDTFGTGLAGFDALFTAAGGSGAFNTASRYLYLYQTVNNGPGAGSFPISLNSVQVFPAFLTSYGTFTGTSFSTTVLGAPAGFNDPGTISTGAAPVVVGGQAGLVTPLILLGSTSIRANYAPEVFANQKSVLFGYTSNQGPVIDHSGLIDGGTTTDGLAASAGTVPEPSAVVLSLIGLPLGLFLRRRLARA